ncbi:TetR/AcrR family transcriptional regulator [Candidatus Clostridium radicumherbarum]|uniref:TetR/AcrR family transcriptional regulator n=1 Tax=Candidatus Clostridium radicumherbarum TaxID=3381662 RepID=A0ABW8TU10_9CLOT
MQYLKEEIKKKITEEALKEFKLRGYKGASIRDIAKNSATSVGNFYKYFRSKDDLFESLIGPVYLKLMDYTNQFNKVEFDDNTENIFYELMEKIMEIFQENSVELTILLNKSEGSKYENCKGTFIDFITRIVTEKSKYELSLENKELKDNFIIYLISNNIVESISIILREKEDGREVRELIINMIDILFKDINSKLNFREA